MHRDVNYFNYDVAKSEIHRVQKALQKELKHFRQRLVQPVQNLLTDNSDDMTPVRSGPAAVVAGLLKYPQIQVINITLLMKTETICHR